MSEDWVRCRADAGHSRSVCRPNLSLRLRRAEIGSRFLRVPGCDNMAAVDESRFERVPSDPTGSRDLLASPCGRDASSVITLGRVCVEYHRLILGSDAMADISILIVVDGIFSLTTTYPINPTVPPCGPEADPTYGPDPWFTVSHLISTLRIARPRHLRLTRPAVDSTPPAPSRMRPLRMPRPTRTPPLKGRSRAIRPPFIF